MRLLASYQQILHKFTQPIDSWSLQNVIAMHDAWLFSSKFQILVSFGQVFANRSVREVGDEHSKSNQYEMEVMMLVLSRREDEKILFPELGITVKVIKTKGNQVRLGISAPESIKVLRGELAFEEPPANPNLQLSETLFEIPRALAS